MMAMEAKREFINSKRETFTRFAVSVSRMSSAGESRFFKDSTKIEQ